VDVAPPELPETFEPHSHGGGQGFKSPRVHSRVGLTKRKTEHDGSHWSGAGGILRVTRLSESILSRSRSMLPNGRQVTRVGVKGRGNGGVA
jgi:hypothetical protein